MKNIEEKIVKFYEQLKPEGLSDLALGKDQKQNKAQLQFLKNHLSKDQQVLDLACGYGRLTIPLAQARNNIEGVDLVPSLIKKAKELAKQGNIKIKFKVGDMRDLPYKDELFDAIICMWSSFNHLLTQEDQIKALKEIVRLLRKKGIAIIDLPYFRRPTTKLQRLGEFLDGAHLFKRKFNGIETTLFLHSKQSLEKVLKVAKIGTYNIKCVNMGGKRRLVLYLYKRSNL